MFGESPSDDSFPANDHKNIVGQFRSTGQQHSAQRVRRHSAGRGRTINNSSHLPSHHQLHATTSSVTNSAANNQFFHIDDLLIDDDFSSILATTAFDQLQKDASNIHHPFDRRTPYNESHNSTATLDGSVSSSQSATSSISSPDMHWLLSDDEDDATLAQNFSDPEVDQITTATSMHISDRALRALSRAPQYHSTF